MSRKTKVVTKQDKLEAIKNSIDSNSDLNEVAEALLSVSDDAKFVENPSDGHDILDLVWNEDRPCVSIRVKKDGVVHLPKNNFGVSKVNSYIWRNYNIIKDGILNVSTLPVSVSRETFSDLLKQNLVSGEYQENHVYLLDISKLPVINQEIAKVPDLNLFCEVFMELEQTKARIKALKYFKDKKFPYIPSVEQFDEETSEYLASLGISKNGFAPRKLQEESTDFYIGSSIVMSVKGNASIPKITDVEAKISSGKSLKWIEEPIVDVIMSDVEKLEELQLNTLLFNSQSESRTYNLLLSKMKFGLILSQRWFGDKEDKFSHDVNGQTVIIEKKDVQVKI